MKGAYKCTCEHNDVDWYLGKYPGTIMVTLLVDYRKNPYDKDSRFRFGEYLLTTNRADIESLAARMGASIVAKMGGIERKEEVGERYLPIDSCRDCDFIEKDFSLKRKKRYFCGAAVSRQQLTREEAAVNIGDDDFKFPSFCPLPVGLGWKAEEGDSQ